MTSFGFLHVIARRLAPALVLAALFSTSAYAQGIATGKPALQRLDTELNRLVSDLDAPATGGAREVSGAMALAIDGRLPVTIRTTDPPNAIAFLAGRGVTPANVLEGVIEAYADLETVRMLNDVAGVQRVEGIEKPAPLVTSEGVAVHNGPNWHAAGFTGAGVKVGVIDLGFQGFSALMGSELPSAVVRRCYTEVGKHSSTLANCETSTEHGTAVAEALVDVSPGVQLYIANPFSQIDLRETVLWMHAEGVRVINHSVAWDWDGPGDGTSPFADSPLRAVDAAVAGGIVFVAAAGNHHGRTWFGSFVDANANGFAEFAGAEVNYVDAPPFSLIRLQLRWQDSWLAPATDLDVGLYDSQDRLVAWSVDKQSGQPGQRPHEAFTYLTLFGGRFYIRVERYTGPSPAWLQLQDFSMNPLGVASAGHSIANPAESANPGMLTVGAASWQTPTVIESFSSRGPTPDGRNKPDIVGADRGASVTYGPTGFSGTSQAAPHVAGLAALVVQRLPAFTPAQVAGYLTAEATRRGSPVPNNAWGWGFAWLPVQPTDACTYQVSQVSVSAPAVGGGGSVTVTPSRADCTWSASSQASWLAITAGQSGAGTGTVTYSIAANPATAPRTGTLTVAGRIVTVNQDAAAASTFKRYFAEGATGSFFDTTFALLNPQSRDAAVTLRFLDENGQTVIHKLTVPAHARRTVNPETLPSLGSASFSTVVESDVEIVADRTMSWGGGYGSHAETGVMAPSTTWYLAEGSTAGDFTLFYLLQNPQTHKVLATVRYLLPFGQTPIDRTYELPPLSRTTIPVDGEGTALASTDVSAVITTNAPIVVERAMYRSTPAQAFAAGHESTGVAAPSTNWFLAEGATGPFFDCFILLANPNGSAVTVAVRYLLWDGTVYTKSYDVPGNGRFTIWMNDEQIPSGSGSRPLGSVTVSTTLTAPLPIIVERTMWWPSPALSANFWTEAHNSPGATATGTRWALADGELGGPLSADTYILIANTSAHAGTAAVTLYFEDRTSVTRAFGLGPNSRTNVNVATDFPEAAGARFGAVIESLGPSPAQIVVERAMYTSPGGVTWAAGTNALATRLH
jgi:subtilisin family serine protease